MIHRKTSRSRMEVLKAVPWWQYSKHRVASDIVLSCGYPEVVVDGEYAVFVPEEDAGKVFLVSG